MPARVRSLGHVTARHLAARHVAARHPTTSHLASHPTGPHLAAAAQGTVHLHISMFQAVVLGLLQGITELFPISSLGHTVLFPTLFQWHAVVSSQADPESSWLAFVVMLHVGSAIGLLIYFWRDWVEIVTAFVRSVVRRRIETPTERLAWLIVVASIPAGILGVALEHEVRVALAKPLAAAIFLMVNGLILLGAERLRRRSERRLPAPVLTGVGGGAAEPEEGAEPGMPIESLSYGEAFVVGVAQSSALIAGISREGVAMTAGLSRGLNHENAARFAFLLATPIIFAAGVFKISDLTGPLGAGVRGQAIVAAACAAVAAVFSVAFLMRWFKTRTLTPFGIYCLVFGLAMVVYTSVN